MLHDYIITKHEKWPCHLRFLFSFQIRLERLDYSEKESERSVHAKKCIARKWGTTTLILGLLSSNSTSRRPEHLAP